MSARTRSARQSIHCATLDTARFEHAGGGTAPGERVRWPDWARTRCELERSCSASLSLLPSSALSPSSSQTAPRHPRTPFNDPPCPSLQVKAVFPAFRPLESPAASRPPASGPAPPPLPRSVRRRPHTKTNTSLEPLRTPFVPMTPLSTVGRAPAMPPWHPPSRRLHLHHPFILAPDHSPQA